MAQVSSWMLVCLVLSPKPRQGIDLSLVGWCYTYRSKCSNSFYIFFSLLRFFSLFFFPLQMNKLLQRTEGYLHKTIVSRENKWGCVHKFPKESVVIVSISSQFCGMAYCGIRVLISVLFKLVLYLLLLVYQSLSFMVIMWSISLKLEVEVRHQRKVQVNGLFLKNGGGGRWQVILETPFLPEKQIGFIYWWKSSTLGGVYTTHG